MTARYARLKTGKKYHIISGYYPPVTRCGRWYGGFVRDYRSIDEIKDKEICKNCLRIEVARSDK